MSTRDDLYGLDHAILSVDIPPKNGMWMNMGYWKNASSLTEACKALLDQILIAAKLLNEDKTPISRNENDAHIADKPVQKQHKIKLIDVGIGCGDQTLYLTRQLSRVSIKAITCSGVHQREKDGANEQESQCLFDSYVGITIVQCQADFVRERLSSGTAPDGRVEIHTSAPKWTPQVAIFAADAANPQLWGPGLNDAVFSKHKDASEFGDDIETWLLALDTLYHFKPSRNRLFRCAHQEMHASIMAYDLVISNSASMWNKLLLRLMCLFTGIPYTNFITRDDYESILIKAGYQRSMIEMHDVTEYVLPGIANYLTKKDMELRRYGLTIGKYKSAGKVFDWWARSGLVRGLIVVARRTVP